MRTLKRLKEILTGEESEEKEKKEQKKPEAETAVKEKPETVEEGKKVEKPGKSEVTGKEKKELEPETKEAKKEKSESKGSEKMTLLEREENILTRENIEENFKQDVIDAGAESVALCFQCGTCTGACPSGRRTAYRVRQLVRRSLLGLKEDLISDDTIWECTTCYECQERCPRKIKIVDIVKIVRNYAAQAGYMAPTHKAVGSYVIKTGHGVPINDVTMELRKRVGLGELPPTTHSFPEALEEVQKIFKTTKFDSLIGYNWKTGKIE